MNEALGSMPTEAAEMAQAESLLRALGITNESELNALLTYFLRDVVPENVAEDERRENEPAVDKMPEPLKRLQVS